jgi:hypothetical protein
VQVAERLDWVAWAGGYEPRPADAPLLRAAMADGDADAYTRLCIAKFLLDLGDAGARAFVARSVRGPDPRVRFNAVECLRRHVGRDPGRRWGVALMLELLDRDDLFGDFADGGRGVGVPLLGAGDPAFPEGDRYDDRAGGRAFVYLCADVAVMRVDAAVPPLARFVRRHPDVPEPVYCLQAFAGDRRAIAAVAETLHDAAGRVREPQEVTLRVLTGRAGEPPPPPARPGGG